MAGDGLSPPTCVIGSPKVGRESYPYHLAGSVLMVGLAIQNTDSSDSMVAAILNHRPEIHAKQHVNPRRHPRKGDRQQPVRASRSWYAYRRPSLPIWMLGLRVKMLSCPVLKPFGVFLSRRSQYRSRVSHQKARSKVLDLASTQLDSPKPSPGKKSAQAC